MKRSILTALAVCLIAPAILASHFDFDTTDSNCSILIQSCYLPEGVWNENDEIGVFNSDGICGGAAIVDRFPLGIAAWGDDALTENVVEGFHEEDSIYFVRWDAINENEIPIEKVYLSTGNGTWRNNGIMVADLSQEVPHYEIHPTDSRHLITCPQSEFFAGADYIQGPEAGWQAAILTTAGDIGGLLIWVTADSAVGWAYGDDPATEDVIEGFEAGEPFGFHYWVNNQDFEITEVFATTLRGDSTFINHGNSAFRLWDDPDGVSDNVSLPEKFEVLGAHPNPFNGRTVISILSPSTGRIGWSLYGVDGRLVLPVTSVNLNPGLNSFSVNLDNHPTGNYILRIDSPSGRNKIPITLIR